MFGPHRYRLCHTALAAVHAATAIVLAVEGAAALALCALAAALIYAALSRQTPGPLFPRPGHERPHEGD